MNDTLQFLQHRNSSPRLTAPAPSSAELEQMFLAALRVPDHAWLRPWRFITITGQRREDFGLPKVPAIEQRLSAGCAAQALLLAAEASGYSGIWRTGDATFDRNVMAALGLEANEDIVALVYLGTRDGAAKALPSLDTADFVSNW